MTVQVVSIPEYLSGTGLARLADLSTLPPITISFLPCFKVQSSNNFKVTVRDY